MSFAAAYAAGTFGAALERAATANGQGHWWRGYVGTALGGSIPEALLRTPIPGSPSPFVEVALSWLPGLSR